MEGFEDFVKFIFKAMILGACTGALVGAIYLSAQVKRLEKELTECQIKLEVYESIQMQ